MDAPVEFIRRYVGWIVAFLGFVMFVVQFLEVLRGDIALATIVFLVAGALAVMVICGYIAFKPAPKEPTELPFPKTRRPWAYPHGQRYAAIGALFSVLMLTAFGGGYYLYRQAQSPCDTVIEAFPSETFGILIADFTEGVDHIPTSKGKELAARTFKALETRLAVSPISAQVTLQRACAIKSEREAGKLGLSTHATLIVWGNVAEFSEDTFNPSFTFVKHSKLLSQTSTDPLLFEVELNRIDSTDLPSKISARVTSVAAFILGVAYLTETEDYRLAIHELSAAIANTEPELANDDLSDVQELSIRRTLATFYVFRGRAHAALEDSENAMRDYAAAESVDATYHATYVGQGNYFYSLRDFAQAEALYRKALSLRRHPSAHYGLGNALFYLGNVQEGIINYLEALRLMDVIGQEPSDVRLVLATVYHLNGETELAIEQLSKIIQSEDNEPNQRERAREMFALFQTVTAATVVPAVSPSISSTHAAALPTATPSPTPIVPTLFPTILPPPTPTPTLFPTPTILPPPTPTPTLFPTPTILPPPTPTPPMPTLFPTPTR